MTRGLRICVIIVFVALIVLLSACKTMEVSKGDSIHPHISHDVRVLTEEILDSIRNNQPEAFMDILTQDIKEYQTEEGIVQICNTIARELVNELVPYGNYYGKTSSLGLFYRAGDSAGELSVSIQGFKNKELYLSLFTTVVNETQENLVSLLFLKEQDVWKLHGLYIGAYKAAGKTCVQWYDEARDCMEKGFVVPAYLRMEVSFDLLNPGPYTGYEYQEDIVDFTGSLGKKVKDIFAKDLPVPNIQSGPVIFGASLQFINGEPFHVVEYVSQLDSPALLEEETLLLHEHVEQVIPGITYGVNVVTYKAYTLNSDKQYPSYTITYEVSNEPDG